MLIAGLHASAAITPSGIPFSADFETYTVGDQILDKNSDGWGASSNSVIVQSGTVHAGGNAAVLPKNTSASNVVSSAETEVWTDVYISSASRMKNAPADIAVDSSATVMLFMNNDGYLVVRNNSAWDVCTTDAVGNAAAAHSGTWAHITVHNNYTTKKADIFLEKVLLRKDVSFIDNTRTSYGAFKLQSGFSDTFLDDLTLSTSAGTGLPIAASTLPFEDDFEDYAADIPLDWLGAFGWSASSADAVVQTSIKHGGAQAAEVSGEDTITNTVSAVGITKTWTDFYVTETIHTDDDGVAVNLDATVMLYMNTNGHIVVYNPTNSNWDVCTEDAWGTPVSGAETWARISVHNNYTTKKAAVFLDGHLLREKIDFINTSNASYTGFVLQGAGTGVSRFDDIAITATVPATLTTDLDSDGIADAVEIHNEGTATFIASGTIFSFR